MQGGKLPCRQLAPDRATQRVQKKSRKTIFRPDKPRRDEKEKGDEIRPMEKKRETESGFTKKNCQENKKRREIKQSYSFAGQNRPVLDDFCRQVSKAGGPAAGLCAPAANNCEQVLYLSGTALMCPQPAVIRPLLQAHARFP